MADPIRPQDWTIEQIGVGSPKSVTLSGRFAPHGRPRQQPVVTTEVAVRESASYFPGSDRPTRHIFGLREEPQTLRGRFADFYLGGTRGAALAKAQELEQLVRDTIPVSIRWGQITSYTGLLKRFKRDLESDYDFAWELECLIDSNDGLTSPPVALTPPRSPVDLTTLILTNFGGIVGKLKLPSAGDLGLRQDILDTIGDLVDAVVSPIAALENIANQVKSFETALAGDLRRLRAAAGQVRTSIITLRDTLDAFGQDGTILVQPTATASIRWGVTRATMESSMTLVLGWLADLDHQAELSTRGRTLKTYTAKGGESWEDVSTYVYGSADGAQKIRDANGIRYGERPTAGRTYTIPANA